MRQTYWFRPQTRMSRFRWWIVRHFMPWRRITPIYGSPPTEGEE